MKTRKELVDYLNALELASRYNYMKDDHESVEEIENEIYKTRQQIQNLWKGAKTQ